MGLIRLSGQVPITEGVLGSQPRKGGLEINNFLPQLPRPRLLDTRVTMQVSQSIVAVWADAHSPPRQHCRDKDTHAGALRKRGESSSVAALLIAPLTQIFVIGLSVENGDQAFSNLQIPLLNVHLAVIRMAGAIMTESSLGGPGVSLDVLDTQQSVLTVTTS